MIRDDRNRRQFQPRKQKANEVLVVEVCNLAASMERKMIDLELELYILRNLIPRLIEGDVLGKCWDWDLVFVAVEEGGLVIGG